MKSKWLPLVICSAAVITASSAFAGFEPLFQVIEINGDCSLQRPTENKLSPAKQSKAYPYGTKIKTGSGSSLVISFSKGNTWRILANGNLTVDESKINKQQKIIRLNDGEVEVNLVKDFSKNGDALRVETATAVCSAIGCKFRVASKSEEDVRIVIIREIEGLIRVHGDNFMVKSLGKDEWLSLLSPADHSYLRLKTLKGDFDVTIKDKDLADKVIATKAGTVLKIWQRAVPGTGQHVVTVVLTGPDGKLIETYTVTYQQGQNSGYGESPAGSEDNGEGSIEVASDDDGKEAGKKGGAGEKGDNPRSWKMHRYDKMPDIDPDPAKDTLLKEAPGYRPPTPTKVGRR